MLHVLSHLALLQAFIEKTCCKYRYCEWVQLLKRVHVITSVVIYDINELYIVYVCMYGEHLWALCVVPHLLLLTMFIRARDVPDVGSGQNFDRIWPDLEQLSSMVIFFNNS